MKRLLEFLCLTLLVINCSAQNPQCRDVTKKTTIDSSFLSITYDFTFAIDTLSDIRYTDRQRLDIGSHFIHYFSLLADKTDSTMYRARISKSREGLNPRNWMATNEKDHYENFISITRRKVNLPSGQPLSTQNISTMNLFLILTGD